MSSYLFDMILCGLAYVFMVYFIVRLVKLKKLQGNNRKEDDDDGGIEFYTDPDLDLPPGVCLPGGPRKKIKLEDPEELFV